MGLLMRRGCGGAGHSSLRLKVSRKDHIAWYKLQSKKSGLGLWVPSAWLRTLMETGWANMLQSVSADAMDLDDTWSSLHADVDSVAMTMDRDWDGFWMSRN